jgi:hypothetical protein
MHTPTRSITSVPAPRRIRRDQPSGTAYLLGRPASVWQAALGARTVRHREPSA